MPLSYPVPPTAEVVEILHGQPVADPFRPLEDPDSGPTREWVAAQNRLTASVLAGFADRDRVRARIAELWDHPKDGVPFERGGRWFQMRNSGLQQQAVLWVSDTPAGGGRVLIDPNTLSADGTVSLTGIGVSRDGSLLAYALSEAGSDWMTWRVRDTGSGRDLEDVLTWSKFSGASWAGDGSGFYYNAAPHPDQGVEYVAETRDLRVMFHRLGEPQSADRVVFEAPGEPDWIPDAWVTEDGRWLVVSVQKGTGTETYLLVTDLEGSDPSLRPLNEPFVAREEVVGSTGDDLLVLSERGAERARVLRARPGLDPEEWPEVVAESADTLLEARLYGGRLVCHYLHDAHSLLEVKTADGRPEGTIDLPGLVAVSGLGGRADSSLVHFQVVSYLQSGSLWSHDLESGRSEEVSPSGGVFEPDGYLTEQVFVSSADGTSVPMFLTRRRDAVADGTARVLLYGYGGFGIPVLPAFSATFAAWLDRGGMVAVASLRGGGEYGRAWHDAGRLAHKQNVFDDFCACARWLAGSGWSSPSRIAISGGSNGGLLVGACLIQHPELFGAAVPEVGVLDMLRFHLFTIGWAWRSDYGDPDDEEQFGWLRSYSPLHNIADGACYPPTMVMTGDHDDRVVPAHSYKFAAALQRAQGCDRPVLLRVSTSAGHGAGKPTDKLIDEAADRLAFLELSLS